jgi:NAD(P)-dependent dehydrogenase (short-subunit alcohol dehydrogenase family)
MRVRLRKATARPLPVPDVILITGASRGIGAATAVLAAERGYDVCVNYRVNRAAADRVVREVEARGRQAIAVQADIARDGEVVSLFETCDRALGRVRALVNNAGVLETQMRVEQMEAARVQRIFATNVIGAFMCAREAVKRMSTKHGGPGGAIVNLSSGAVKMGAPGEYVDYAASKAAIETLTIGLAHETAQEGIRVNGVRAGYIYTEIHASGGEPNRVDRVKGNVPMRRGGQPEEVARAILWLLSEDPSFTTGSFIDVTGGR